MDLCYPGINVFFNTVSIFTIGSLQNIRIFLRRFITLFETYRSLDAIWIYAILANYYRFFLEHSNYIYNWDSIEHSEIFETH